MSAICGIMCFGSNTVPIEMKTMMIDKLKSFPIDHSGIWYEKQIYLGNVIKYITPESRMEKLPYMHPETRLVITADAIIDNRNELLSIFQIPVNEWERTPDSELILRSYIKWGEDCPKYLIGDFAFAIWNEKRKELFCARDHVGKRTFYYYHSKELFAFCTIINPLLNIKGKCSELNDDWIAEYLSLDSLIHEVDCSKTVYKDIKQLLPAHTLKINNNEIVLKRYWNPLDIPQLKLKDNKQYEEAFQEVFFQAVNCRLRSIGSVGVMLSGGLDSGSVASVAASMLDREGKKLKAFSSIPFEGYKDWLPKSLVANEREYIEAILSKYKNIDIKYCSCNELNSVNNIEQLIEIIEQPYKIVQNFFWSNEITSMAANEGCSILLDGQYGNYTISFGDITSYLLTLYKEGKLLSLLREINYFCKFHNCKYNEVLKYLLSIILPDSMKYVYHKLKGDKISDRKIERNVVINKEFALKNNVDARLRKIGIGPYKKDYEDIFKIRESINKYIFLSQAATIETKMSLQHGIAKRDPTRDKRIIEFCFSLPINQFVYKGEERSLIRRTMVDILPNEIRLNHYTRGSQGADFVQRLEPQWSNIKEELQSMSQKSRFSQYIDISKVLTISEHIENYTNDQKHLNMQMVIMSIVFGRFIDGLT